MAKKRFHDSANEHYAGLQERRAQEREDAGMISEDHNAIANLPQSVVMRPYPKNYGYLPEVLDDTIRGIDKQVDMDDSKRSKNFMPKKV
jgi:hypothetical protein